MMSAVVEQGRLMRWIVALGATAGLMLALTPSAFGAAFVVDDLDDASDTTLTGTCDADGADTCTLRAATEEANSNANPGTADTITFSVSGTHTLTLGDLGIVEPVAVTGNGQAGGAGGTTIDANASSRVIEFGTGVTSATLNDLRITGGKLTDAPGAGINSFADSLTLNRVTVTGNTIDGAGGGGTGAGISTFGSSDALTLNDSTVSDNANSSAAGTGGGIRALGPLTLNRSTVSGNKAAEAGAGRGGGLFMGGTPNTITNSTISGNQSGTDDGGGIFATGGGTLTITNSTIAGNSTTGDGGGLRTTVSTDADNTIFAANTASLTNPNCDPGFSSPVNNIDSPGSSCLFGTMDGNQENVSAAALTLGALASNGGPTQTRALGAGSVAIDAGDNTTCAAAPVSNLDQRSVVRPQDGDGNGSSICDIGAFELAPAPPPPPPGDGGTTPPSNEITIGSVKGKKLSVEVPGAGTVEVTDAADTSSRGASAAAKKKLLKPSSATASGAGTVTVALKLTKTAKGKLKSRGKVKVNAAITFTPTGGTANTETAKLKLKK